MVAITYQFKPKSDLRQRSIRAVEQLKALPGLESLTLSDFYSYSIEKSLENYERTTDGLFQELNGYLNRNRGKQSDR